MPSLFIALENKIPNLDPYVNGSWLSKHDEELADLSRQLKLTPLMEFFSQDPEVAKEMLEDAGVDATTVPVPPEKFFPAIEGLNSISPLIGHLKKKSTALSESAHIVAELVEWENLLTHAKNHNIRWHLEVDF